MPEPFISPIKDNSPIIYDETDNLESRKLDCNYDKIEVSGQVANKYGQLTNGHQVDRLYNQLEDNCSKDLPVVEGEEETPLNLSMMPDVLDICGDDGVFEGSCSISVFRARSNSLNEASLCSNKDRKSGCCEECSPFRRRSKTVDENLLRKSYSDSPDSVEKTRRGSLSLDSFCDPQHYSNASNVPRKTLSHSLSPPTQTNNVVATGFNRSPFGGMSLFQVDTPNTAKYTHSGIKIDFSDQRISVDSVQKHPSSARIEDYIADQMLMSKPIGKSNNAKGQRKVSKSEASAMDTGSKSESRDKLFNIYRDTKKATSREVEKNRINSYRHVLKERNRNIEETFRKQSKKRKPTASLGNEKKIQVISDN